MAFAVHHHRLRRRRDVPRQPLHERVHLGDVLRAGRDVLLAPARDLALVVVAGPAEGTEPHGLRRHRVQGREHVGEVAVDGGSLGGRSLGHEGVRVDPSLHLLHHVELRADDAGVLAEQVHPRNRHRRRFESLHHPVLPVHLVGGPEELARRLLAQHVLPAAGLEEERRVALPPFELAHHERLAGGKARQRRAQESLESPFVEAVSGPHRRQLGNVAHGADPPRLAAPNDTRRGAARTPRTGPREPPKRPAASRPAAGLDLPARRPYNTNGQGPLCQGQASVANEPFPAGAVVPAFEVLDATPRLASADHGRTGCARRRRPRSDRREGRPNAAPERTDHHHLLLPIPIDRVSRD